MRKTVETCLTMLLAVFLITATAVAGKGGGGKPKPPPAPADPAIAFSADGVLSVMNADGSNVTTVLDGEGADIGKPRLVSRWYAACVPQLDPRVRASTSSTWTERDSRS